MKKRIGRYDNFFSNIIVINTIGFIILMIPSFIGLVVNKVSLKVILIEYIIFNILNFTVGSKLAKRFEIKPTFKEKYYRELPNIKPAVLIQLLYGKNMKSYDDVKATLLDLVNRKHLTIYKVNGEYKLKNNKKTYDNLLSYEKKLIEWIFKENEEIFFKDIANNFKEDKFTGYKLEGWKNLVQIEVKNGSYLIVNERKKKFYSLMFLILVLIFLFQVLLIWSEYTNKSLCIITTVLMTIVLGLMNFSSNEYSMQTETLNEIEKSKALKRYIEEYSLLDNRKIEEVEIWEGYLVYACALDSSKAVDDLFDKIIKNSIFGVDMN